MMLEKASNHLHHLHRNAVVWDDALDNAKSFPDGTVATLSALFFQCVFSIAVLYIAVVSVGDTFHHLDLDT